MMIFMSFSSRRNQKQRYLQAGCLAVLILESGQHRARYASVRSLRNCFMMLSCNLLKLKMPFQEHLS
ncbi:hypothetical protein B4071_3355 [Bacillus subtilis]|uniref:Uncharacterized protein n=1 Tax=Bacillus subtilis subsp. subtilis TaxID=135461 RepID=A0ABD3ZS11_BACIU|nr:hypothetical protein B4067_3694 [Bacillus subtilis subsp. subtilis]KIN33096.1 hypothetical protein B4070_3311 [Bacillus subtilis]KIN43950.1 hypothetical protein B4071_3355 [Bacillus subtilis]